jgi:hypothetical protein
MRELRKHESFTIDRNGLRLERGAFPAEFVEQRLQFEFAKQLLKTGSVKIVILNSPVISSQPHRADEFWLALLVLIVNDTQPSVFAQREDQVD